MINKHSGSFLFLIFLTILASSGCRPANTTAAEDAPVWRTTKSGSFGKGDVFYGQFGPAPFDIAVSTPPGPAKAGTKIRYRIFSSDRKTVIFTALMEKQSSTALAEGGWAFQTMDDKEQALATSSSCIDCHRQQAGNDYLFSLSADTLE